MKKKYEKPELEEIVLSLNERLASGTCETEGSKPTPPPGFPGFIDDEPIS
jgi:hypothetical protein